MKNSFKKGFSLVEVLVTITIFALILGALMGFIMLGYKTYNFSWQQAMAINEARKGVETMVKEIREAKTGEDGSYPIERAGDKEFVFYADIDKDGDVERVRYFLGSVGSDNSSNQECVTFSSGGSCDVTFSNFLSGELELAQVRVSVEGDFGWSQESAEIYADGVYLGRVCQTGCSDCAGNWEGVEVFDVTTLAEDDSIQFIADSSWRVDDFCDWQEPNHSMKAKFELSWTENLPHGDGEFKKGVINPVGDPSEYPTDQEIVTVLSDYVRNAPPIFRYFDGNGEEIQVLPSRLVDTKLMEVFLVVNVDPNRSPFAFELKSAVQLRNLKEE